MNKRVRWLLLPLAVMLLLCLTACDFTMYVAHYTYQSGFTTQLSIKNPYSQSVSVTITAYNDAGAQTGTKTVNIPAFGFYKAYIQNVFAPTVVPATGSLKIVSSEPESYTPKVSAIVLIEYTSGGLTSLAGLQSLINPQKVLNFPWFENSATNFTGVAFMNVNDYPIQVMLKATSAAGSAYYSYTYNLNPMQRLIGYPSTFFPGALPAECTLSAYGSGPIAGFIILHDAAVRKFEAINAVPVQVKYPDLLIGGYANTGINLGSVGERMVISPDGNYAYIRSGNSVKCVRLTDNVVINTTAFVGPGDIAYAADGRVLIISDLGDNKVKWMYPPTGGGAGTVYTWLTLTFTPDFIAISNNGEYLGISGGNVFRVVNYNTSATVFNGSVAGGNMHQCCFSDDSRIFFAADSGNSKIQLCNTSTAAWGSIVVPAEPYSVAFNSYASVLYVGPWFSSEHSVWRFNYPSYSAASTLTVDPFIYQFAFSPDGRKAYMLSSQTSKLYVYDELYEKMEFGGSGMADPQATGGAPRAAAMSPEGDRLYYAVGATPYPLYYFY